MPKLPKRVHIIGICGRASAGLATQLHHRGCRVTGSETHVFPPLDSWLESRGISFHREYAARHVPKDADLVISGPLATSQNPEWRSARRKKIPILPGPTAHGGKQARGQSPRDKGPAMAAAAQAAGIPLAASSTALRDELLRRSGLPCSAASPEAP